MNKKQFWKIIDQAKEQSKGDQQKQLTFIEEQLNILKPKEIVKFDYILTEYQMYYAFLTDLGMPIQKVLYTMGIHKVRYEYNDFDSVLLWFLLQGKKIFTTITGDPSKITTYFPDKKDIGSILGGILPAIIYQAYRNVTGATLKEAWDAIDDNGNIVGDKLVKQGRKDYGEEIVDDDSMWE